MANLSFDCRWKWVSCAKCGREYQCTPNDDYYNATSAQDGLCEVCLLAGMKLTKNDLVVVQIK